MSSVPFGVVGLNRMGHGHSRVNLGSLGSLWYAMGVAGFNPGVWVHLGAPWCGRRVHSESFG